MARYKGNLLTFHRHALFFCLFLTFAGGTVGQKAKEGNLGHPPKLRFPWHPSSLVKQYATNGPYSLLDKVRPGKRIDKETPLLERRRPHNGQDHKAQGREQNKMQRPDSQQQLKGGQGPHRHHGEGEINMQKPNSPTIAEKTKGEEHTRIQKIPLNSVEKRVEIQRPHQHIKHQSNIGRPHQIEGQTKMKKLKSKHSQATADDELMESYYRDQTTERTFIQRHNQTIQKIKIQRPDQTIEKTRIERPEQHQTILQTKIQELLEHPTAHKNKSTEPTEVLEPHNHHTTESTKMQSSHPQKTTQQSNMQKLQTTNQAQIPHHQTITEQIKVQRPQTTEQSKMYRRPENKTAKLGVLHNLHQTTEQIEFQTSRHFKTTEPSKIHKNKKNGNDFTKMLSPEKHKSNEKKKEHKQNLSDLLKGDLVGLKEVAKKHKKRENHKKGDHNGFIEVPDETLTEENSPQEQKPKEKTKKHHHGKKATGKSHKGDPKFHKPKNVEDDPEVDQLEKELESLDNPTRKKKKTKKLSQKGKKIKSVEKGRKHKELPNEADRVYNIIDKVQEYASKLRHPTVHISDGEQNELRKLMKLGIHPSKVNLHMLEGLGPLLGNKKMVPFKIESLETSNPVFKSIDEVDPQTPVIKIEEEPLKEEPKTEAPMTVPEKESEKPVVQANAGVTNTVTPIKWREAITSTQPPPPQRRKGGACNSNLMYRFLIEGFVVFVLLAIISIIIGVVVYKKRLLKDKSLKEFSLSSNKNDNYGGKVSGLHRSRKNSRYIVSVLDESRRSDSDSMWSSDEEEEEEIFDASTLKSDSPVVAQEPSSKLKKSVTSTPVKKKLKS